MPDTTIADIHRTRAKISEAFGGDLHAITEDARKRQEASGRRTVNFAESGNKNRGVAGTADIVAAD